MNEQEWLNCSDSTQLIAAVLSRSSHRKLRLFTTACCYHSRQQAQEPAHPVLECVLDYADGVVSLDEVRKHWASPTDTAIDLSWPEQPLEWASGFVADCAAKEEGYPPQDELLPFLRDVFGNPFRPVSLDPAWLTSDVLALARGIYAERAFDRMPILADALQDAGCDDELILSHCREGGPHVRGCWVVDLLLGKA